VTSDVENPDDAVRDDLEDTDTGVSGLSGEPEDAEESEHDEESADDEDSEHEDDEDDDESKDDEESEEPAGAGWIRRRMPARLTNALLLRIAGVAVCTLAVAVSCLVAELALLGRFEQRHEQQIEYARLRGELAAGTAPIGTHDYLGHLLTPGEPVAIIAIPAIGVNEVVGEGTTGAILESGPGHERDTVLPGQLGTSVVMGRSAAYGGPFRYLDQLQAGDRIDVTTGQGVSSFRVRDVRRPGDTVPAPPGPGQGRLTLVSATGSAFAPNDQIRVDADLATDAQPTPPGAAPHVAAVEAAMAVDHGARKITAGFAAALILAAVLAFWAAPRWGRAKTWLTAVPVLLVLGLALADRIALLLPNLT
jgi:LPXTG-site transpeptidase (sortase) family protein